MSINISSLIATNVPHRSKRLIRKTMGGKTGYMVGGGGRSLYFVNFPVKLKLLF